MPKTSEEYLKEISRRHPPVRTGKRRRQGIGEAEVELVPAPPSAWPGTLPEWKLYWAHRRLGLQELHQFIYNVEIPEDSARFVELDLNMALVIDGTNHQLPTFGVKRPQSEIRIELESLGYLTVILDEDSVMTDPLGALRDARKGVTE